MPARDLVIGLVRFRTGAEIRKSSFFPGRWIARCACGAHLTHQTDAAGETRLSLFDSPAAAHAALAESACTRSAR